MCVRMGRRPGPARWQTPGPCRRRSVGIPRCETETGSRGSVLLRPVPATSCSDPASWHPCILAPTETDRQGYIYIYNRFITDILNRYITDILYMHIPDFLIPSLSLRGTAPKPPSSFLAPVRWDDRMLHVTCDESERFRPVPLNASPASQCPESGSCQRSLRAHHHGLPFGLSPLIFVGLHVRAVSQCCLLACLFVWSLCLWPSLVL